MEGWARMRMNSWLSSPSPLLRLEKVTRFLSENKYIDIVKMVFFSLRKEKGNMLFM